MSMTQEPTCEERIAAHEQSRAADFEQLFNIMDTGAGEYDDEQLDAEAADERLAEFPLAVTLKRVVRIDLSTGGPGDWLEATLDADGDVERVEYHFVDWFDHAQRNVEQDSPLWRAAEHFAEFVKYDR